MALTGAQLQNQEADRMGGLAQDTRLVASALIGVGVVAVIQLTTAAVLTRRLLFAVYCFAASIPLLSFFVLVLHFAVEKTEAPAPPLFIWMYLIGCLLSLAGVSAIFFHLDIQAGYLFSGVTIFALVFVPLLFKLRSIL